MNCYKFTIHSKIFYVISETTFEAINCLFEAIKIGWFDLRTGDDLHKLADNEMIRLKVLDDKGQFIAYLSDHILTAKESVINIK